MTIPRRSVLFMPGSNARALEKAKTIDADTLVFDLEDAVAPSAKADARALVIEALQSNAYGRRELVVRINGLDTDWWQEDIEAVAPAGPKAILVPKVEKAADAEAVMNQLAASASDWPGELWVMMETPMGFLKAAEIAAAHERLTTIAVGTNDLIKELRGRHTTGRQPVMTALGLAMLAARAHGLTILDGVYNNFKDADGFEFECAHARDMGFDGKTLIHPSQVEAANRIFGPSDAELETARRMIAAFEAAQAEGKGVAVLDGRMIEELHLAEARRMVAMAAAISGD